MGHIEKRTDKKGKVSYRAQIRKAGFAANQTFKTKALADEWIKDIETKIVQGRYFPHHHIKGKSLFNLIEAYSEHLKAANPRRYREIEHQLRWWTDNFGANLLIDLRPELFAKAQTKLLKKTREGLTEATQRPLSPSTVNRYIQALKGAISYAVDQLGWMPTNPLSKIKQLKEPEGRTRFLTHVEIPILLDACRKSQNPNLFDITLLCLSTGARKSEIVRLRWDQVHLDQEIIILSKTKTGAVRSLPLTGAALEALIARKSSSESRLVFPSKSDPKKSTDIKTAWYTALDRAGISNFRFHDTRHTAASFLALSGGSLIDIMTLLGHKSPAMAKRYTHLTEPHMTTAVSKMNQHMFDGGGK